MKFVVIGTSGVIIAQHVALGLVQLQDRVVGEPVEVQHLAGVSEIVGVTRGGRTWAKSV